MLRPSLNRLPRRKRKQNHERIQFHRLKVPLRFFPMLPSRLSRKIVIHKIKIEIMTRKTR